MGSWLAGLSLMRASAGLTPTACGPSSGYNLEPRVSVAVICDQSGEQPQTRSVA
jgi:hypothetical protein